MKIKKEFFQALRPSVDANAIEEEIFDGHPYGFARLNFQYISASIVTDIGKREQRTAVRHQVTERCKHYIEICDLNIKLCDVNDSPSQKRVEQRVDSSAQVLIDTSEIHREETPGKKERYFP